MKKVFIFLLFLVSGQILNNAQASNAREIDDLRKEIARITQTVRAVIEKYPEAKSAIVLGPTGSGKSTLVNILAEKKFKAVLSTIGYTLETGEPLPGIKPSKGNVAGTRVPGAWYDKSTNTVFWDCPGFGDPRGVTSDIINAFCIYSLFRPQSKIVLVIEEPSLYINRGTKFVELLHYLTNVFPQKDLTESLSIIVTKQRDIQEISNYFTKEILSVEQDEQSKLTPQVRNLLGTFVKNPKRIARLPAPSQVGNYSFDFNSIQTSVTSTSYLSLPRPVMQLSDESYLYVRSLGEITNQAISKLIKSQVCLAIRSRGVDLIDDEKKPIEAKVAELKSLESNLNSVKQKTNSKNPVTFSEELAKAASWVQVDEIRSLTHQVVFLMRISGKVKFDLDGCFRALLPAVVRVQELRQACERMKGVQDVQKKLSFISDNLPKDVSVGTILAYAGQSAPEGWLLCDGKLVSKLQYPALHTIIGKIYTHTDEKSTTPLSEDLFNIPDLRGRIPVGVDLGVKRVTSNNKLGQSGGEESHTLTVEEIPPHSHSVSGQDGLNGASICFKGQFGARGTSTSSTGGGKSHNNLQPYLALNYIIKYK